MRSWRGVIWMGICRSIFQNLKLWCESESWIMVHPWVTLSCLSCCWWSFFLASLCSTNWGTVLWFVYLFCFLRIKHKINPRYPAVILKEATLNGLGPKTRLEAWTPPVVSLNSVSSLGSGWKSHKGHKGSPRWSQRERRLNTEHQYIWFGRAYQGSSSWLILLGVLLLRIFFVVGTFTSACIYMLQWNPAIKMVSRMQLLVLDIWCVHFIFWQSTQSIIVQCFHHNYIGTIPA